MKTATIVEIVVTIIVSLGIIIYLMRRNVEDEEENK